jgi:hypothetical protein
MPGVFSGIFDFRSKEEKEKSFKAYSKRIFPYGEAQKDAISEILAELFPEENKRYLLMYYVLTKQGMTEDEPMDFEKALSKAAKCKLLPMTEELKYGIKALLNIDFEIDEKLEYPSIDKLRNDISNLLTSQPGM